jgi:polar amino acid transport system substrate-binding protein
MIRTVNRAGRRAGIALALPALVLAACGGSSGSSSSGTSSGPALQANIASELPSAIKSKGSVQVATDATYAPNEFIDPNTGQISGWDIDLAKEVSAVLGIPFVISNADFNSIIPDLGTRYDIGFSSFTPNTDREKVVDFVSYYQAGEGPWIITAGGPSVTQASDMCGHTVAVETGTIEESDAWGFMGRKPDGTAIAGDANNCAKAGKPDITVHSFTKQTEANADLLGGRSQVGWVDEPVAHYQVKLNSQLKLTGQACSVAPYGIAIVKGSGMIKPIQDAIKYLIDNGFYTTLLQKWQVQSGAIASSAVTLNNNTSVGATCVPSY